MQSEDQLDRVFGALSNQTRRALLVRLSERGSARITELAEPLPISLPAVSKHIRVLERAGLVRREIDGRVHHCSLDGHPLEAAQRWLARHRVFWTETLDALAYHVEHEDEP